MKLSSIIFIVAVIFSILETAYFGFNWVSHSPAETVCDCIVIGMVFLGLYVKGKGK
jgi:hypothetical protein